MINFEQIQSDIRTPLCQIEINNTGAVTGTVTALNNSLFIGQRFDTGTAKAGELVNVTSASQAKALFGRGSMLATMISEFKDLNTATDIWAIALDDDEDAAAAVGSLTVTGTATGNGTLSVLIAGTRVRVGVETDDTAADIAAAVIEAINEKPDLPVTASAPDAPEEDAPNVLLTARHAGECGNDIDVRCNYYTGEAFPAGVSVDITALSGGTANPELDIAIAAMGAQWFKYVVNPYTDAASLLMLAAELVKRWGPDKMNDGQAFMAWRGTLSETATFGSDRNEYLFSTMGTGIAPPLPYVWASRVAAVAIASLVIDPARPLQTLAVSGLLPPAASDTWEREDREMLLHDGISTYTVNNDTVQIERLITMYRTDAYGNADVSYLDVCTPQTLSYIRYATRVRIEQKFPRCKLADDGTPVAAGQAIVTPLIIKDELIALAGELNTQGLIENVDDFADSLIVERNTSDRNRVDVYSRPDLVNQFRVYAQAINFIL